MDRATPILPVAGAVVALACLTGHAAARGSPHQAASRGGVVAPEYTPEYAPDYTTEYAPDYTTEYAPDYAPSGMPDFSQCQAPWGRAGQPGQWTHAGPVAVANALWWLDSVADDGAAPPPAVADGFGLVTAYPRFGPAIDDHAAGNLAPLVEDLAYRFNTEGAARRDDARGTVWEDLVAGTQRYIAARALAGSVHARVEAGAGVAHLDAPGAPVVLLGLWERQGTGLRRVGGHYATVAAADSDAGVVLLADPLADRGSRPNGRLVPPDPALHSCREAPTAHDDAAVVSHDAYLLATSALPHGGAVLEGYFSAANLGEAAAFAGQNEARYLAPHRGSWQGGEVTMAIDAALILSLSTTEAPTATPTRAASPTPSATSTLPPSPSPTATATGVPTSGLAPPVRPPPGGQPAVWLPLCVVRLR